MPVLLNQIDSFSFDAMDGALDLPAEQSEVFVRPGIDGHGARQTGSRATPVKIRTVRYVLNWAEARTVMIAYHAIVNVNPVSITHNDVDHGSFLVTGVKRLPSTRAVFNVQGSITANPQVRLEAEWTVLYSAGP